VSAIPLPIQRDLDRCLGHELSREIARWRKQPALSLAEECSRGNPAVVRKTDGCFRRGGWRRPRSSFAASGATRPHLGMQRQHPHSASNSRSSSSPSGRSIATTSTSKHTSAAHYALTPSSTPAAPRRPGPRSARRASRKPSRSRRNCPSLPPTVPDDSTAPQPGGAVTGAHRQGPHQRLRPVAARGISPPPGTAGLSRALRQRQAGRALSRRPVEATTGWLMSRTPREERG
jgi:hypothetical protein